MASKVKVFGSNNSTASSNISIFNSYETNASTITNIGSFLITTNNTTRVISNNNTLTSFSSSINLDSLQLTETQINSILNQNNEISLNIDKTNLLNYARYGSLFERFKASVDNIITLFPASVYIDGIIDDFTTYNTFTNYIYDSFSDIATFRINKNVIYNKFNLNLNNSEYNNDVNNNELKNLPISYDKYMLFDIKSNKEYQVNGFTGYTQSNQQYISVSVYGNPFSGNTNGSDIFHIKPMDSEYGNFYSKLDYFEKYLLNKDNTPKYTITVKVPYVNEDDDSIIYNEKSFTWTTSDNYNIDIDNTSFKNYFNDLISICNTFDTVKTDIVNRMLMTNSVLLTDTSSSFKSQQYSRILGREIDEIKRFVDGISFVNNVSYDKVENVSDNLIKNLANTLGFSSFNFIETDDLFASIFDTSINKTYASNSGNKTPYELDIELWRNILINTNYLFKSKGTRQSIETVFSLLGLPEAFIEINEHVYTIDGVINPNTVDLNLIYPLNEQLTKLPYDNNGYPVASNEISNFYFQISGNSDNGQHYIDIYRKLGFNVNKRVDNKKSWVYSTGQTRHFDTLATTITDYDVNDSRLLINTKEVSIYLDPVQAIEDDVYKYNVKNNYPISSTGRTYPYPNRNSTKYSVTGQTFLQYIDESFSNFINVQNRKTISSANGINYPTLFKLYEDYLLINNSNKYDLNKMNSFISKFQNLYNKLIEQLLSVTVIISENGIKTKNLVYTEQKFDYKNGIDVSSEFQNTQPLDLQISLNSATIQGSYNKQLVNNTYLFNCFGDASYTGTKGGGSNPNGSLLSFYSNINVDTRINYNMLTLETPTFVMTGATKIGGNLTNSNSIYYYSNVTTGKTLVYKFTSNVDILLNNPENTFSYDIYTLDKTTNTFNTLDLTYINTYPNYSGNTNALTNIIDRMYLTGDTEYIIKPFYTYKTTLLTGDSIDYNYQLDSFNLSSLLSYPIDKNSYNYYFDNNISYSGFTFSTRDNGFYDLPYGNYNNNSDFYFVSVYSPEIPNLLTTGVNNNNNTPITIGQLFTEGLTPLGDGTFTLSYQPSGDIDVMVNGNRLQKNIEYSGYTTLPAALNLITYKLLVPFTSVDSLNVSYIVNSEKNKYVTEFENITYIIPTGTTRTNLGRVFYNQSTHYYNYVMDVASYGDPLSSIIITYNGNALAPIYDYSVDTLNNNRLIFNNIIVQSGDTFTVSYLQQSASYIQMNGISQEILFNIPNAIPNNENGYFTLELSNDDEFTTIATSETVDYITDQSSYSFTIDLSKTPYSTNLSYKTIYFGRIKSTRTYTTVDDREVLVDSISSTFQIMTP